MSPFTEAAMERPLFEQPGSHIERPDPFTGPQGFLFGESAGMGGSPDNLSLAQDYMEAAYVLTEAIKRGDWGDYRVAEPLMFLYRHLIELFLKGVASDTPASALSHQGRDQWGEGWAFQCKAADCGIDVK